MQRATSRLTISRGLLTHIIKGGPGRLLSLVPLRPVLGPKRRFLGFEIVRIHDNSARVLSYGVRPGDRIIRINGRAIVYPDDMLQLFRKLDGADEIVVEVQRKKTPMKFIIPVVNAPRQ